MAIKSVVTCDSCGQQKKEVNHWFLIDIDEDGFHAATTQNHPGHENSRPSTLKDVCGANCAQNLFEKWLQSQGAQIIRESENNKAVS